MTWKKKKNLKQIITYEEKGEFGGPLSEHLCFKRGTPTMLGPDHQKLINHGDNLNTLYPLHNFDILLSIMKVIICQDYPQ